MDVISINPTLMDPDYASRLCAHLEQGDILLLNETPYMPSEEDCAFLRAQQQSDKNYHKNIAYKPHLDKTTGVKDMEAEQAEQMNRILATFSKHALEFMGACFPNYARSWQVDYASFRPVEEEGRDLPLKHRNDLMHVDAFPTRPTHGGRILRAFTNLNAERSRVWAVSDSFEELAASYAQDAGLSRVGGALGSAKRAAGHAARLVGVRLPDRSPYDEFMLGFHHYLKANDDFQKNRRRKTIAFPPRSTWISFTDQVAHAVLSGQYALEQTCIVPYAAMLLPEKSPVAVLEKLAGRPLIEHKSAITNASEHIHA